MAQRRTIVLAAEQRRELTECRDHHGRPDLRERCAAILKIAEGHSPHRVACHGLLKPRDPDTVYGWLNTYQQFGIVGLIGRRHGGRRRRSL